MGTDTCVKCGYGGDMLVCSSSKCPVSVHESCCVPSSLQVHDGEIFVCPYCLYKQSVTECCQAKDKARLAEKNLALFLGAQSSVNREHGPGINVDNSALLQNREELGNQESGRKNEERAWFQAENGSKYGTKGGYLRSCSMKPVENQKNWDDQFCGSVPSKWEGDVLVVEPLNACRLSTPMHDYAYENQNSGKAQQHLKPLDLCNKETERVKRAEMDLIKGKNKGRKVAGPCEKDVFSIAEDNRPQKYEESDSMSETYTDCTDRSEGKACDPDDVNTGDAGWIDRPSKEIGALSSRRKRVRWTTEEEEMLMKGVSVFSSSSKKNIPWRKILESGSHVFHELRTPVDLQSKWKIISRKKSKV